MADYWTTPKTNWLTSDGIGYEDLNRIEANISANRDGNFRKVQGFGFKIDNSIVGQDGVITVFPGSCYSENGYPIRMNANYVKNLTTWVQGNGATFGGMASAVTVAAITWYYIFVIMNPIDGSTEIVFDDNPSGTNISSGTYTEKRRIGSFKTSIVGGDGSYDLIEMYSIGDHTFINPNSLYAQGTIITAGGGSNNLYRNITLSLGIGVATPALNVKADLNIISTNVSYGLISNYQSIFTIPANFITAGVPYGEFSFMEDAVSGGTVTKVIDLAIMIDPASQINFAHKTNTIAGDVEIRVRGFHDDRLI